MHDKSQSQTFLSYTGILNLNSQLTISTGPAAERVKTSIFLNCLFRISAGIPWDFCSIVTFWLVIFLPVPIHTYYAWVPCFSISNMKMYYMNWWISMRTITVSQMEIWMLQLPAETAAEWVSHLHTSLPVDKIKFAKIQDTLNFEFILFNFRSNHSNVFNHSATYHCTGTAACKIRPAHIFIWRYTVLVHICKCTICGRYTYFYVTTRYRT